MQVCGSKIARVRAMKDQLLHYVGVNFWIHTHEPEVLRALSDRVAAEIEALYKTPAKSKGD
jgi:hypothetical protein